MRVVPKLVVSHSYESARRFARNNHWSTLAWRYVRDENDLMGMQDCEVFFIGKWWENPHIHAINQVADAMNIKTFTPEPHP